MVCMFLQCNDSAQFSIAHTFYCKKCGLMTNWHNKLYDRVPDLARKDFAQLHVLHDLLFQNGHSMHVNKSLTSGNQEGA